MSEKVIFTNMCMIYDDNKVVVIDRKKERFPGNNFPRRACRNRRIIY